MTRRGILAAVLLAATLAAGGCGSKAGGGASPTPSPVKPIADCVSQDEQRAGGLRLDTEGGKHLDALVVGSGATGIVLAGIDALRKKGAQKVLLVGASMGGTAVLAAAAKAQPLVAGVVSLSGPQVYQGVDAFGAVQRLTVSVLFIAAKDDEGFGRDAQALYDACASKDKKLDLEIGGDHGMSLLDDRIGTMVEDFLNQRRAP